MKMAKASNEDLDMAMDLCGAIDALTNNWPTMPEALSTCDDDAMGAEHFDRDDDKQCGKVLRHLLEIAERGSLMRVVFGAAVMLDPRNKLVDPDADTIEHHPETLAAKQDTAALNWIERQHLQELSMGLAIDAPNDGKYYVCGDSCKTHYGKTLREALASAMADGA